jgi:glycosyltransferase involved in cell wall biosynthesis
MRVLHVVAPSHVGGIERVVQLLATAQHEAGDAVSVVAVSAPDESDAVSTFLAPIVAGGVDVHRIEIPPRAYHQERSELRALCGRIAADVVHTHGYRVDVVDGAGFRRAGLPTVATAHGFVGGSLRNRGYEWLQRRALRGYHAVAAVSKGIAGRLAHSGVSQSRIRVLPNAWRATSPLLTAAAARAELGITDTGFRVGWIGRVEPEKGLDVMIDALSCMRGVQAQLSVIGDGSAAPGLKRRAFEKGVAGMISWHGMKPSAERLLAAFDVLVLSSRTEGIPMVLLEAMAAEIPIVATAVGGVPDMLGGEEAILVPTEDSPAIAEAVRSVWANRADAERRARAARDRVYREFNVGPWVDGYRGLYLDAMTSTEPR